MATRAPRSAAELRLRAAVRDFAEGVARLVPSRSKRLVLNTIVGACARRIKWKMLFTFLKTFVTDKMQLSHLIRKLAQVVRDEKAAVFIAHRKLATGTRHACTVCFSFEATDPCMLCGAKAVTCCGCEGFCSKCEK